MAIKIAKNYRNYSLKVKIEKGIRFSRTRKIEEKKTFLDLEGTVLINQTIVSGIIFKLFNQNRIIIIKDNYYYYGEFELIEKYCKILLLEKI